ncbi:MAG: thiamine phosphate synthase [Gallionellaceae bacterium]
MLKRPVIKGLYAITPNELDTAELLRKTRLILLGGATILQYRNKIADKNTQLNQAIKLRSLTREFGATFIINDDARLTKQVDADGVHLGGDDGSVAAARAILGSEKIIGVSCYNQPGLALAAVQQGADYIAFGAFFSSSVKPEAVRATPEILHWARSELTVPLVAIGGITLANAASVVEAGAHALAVISALFDAEDIQGTAQQFSTFFNKVSHDIA